MPRCTNNTETIRYGGPETAKRWQCPPGSTGRYVYLLAEDDTKDPGLIEVKVYGINDTSSGPLHGSEYVRNKTDGSNKKKAYFLNTENADLLWGSMKT